MRVSRKPCGALRNPAKGQEFWLTLENISISRNHLKNGKEKWLQPGEKAVADFTRNHSKPNNESQGKNRSGYENGAEVG